MCTNAVTSILIVDDETGIRKSFESFFTDHGYNVFSAGTAEKAMHCMEQNKLDIVIVDLILPDIGGEELILKMSCNYPELKFIIHTGSVDFQLSKKLKEIGLTERNVINKPQTDMNNFIRIMESV